MSQALEPWQPDDEDLREALEGARQDEPDRGHVFALAAGITQATGLPIGGIEAGLGGPASAPPPAEIGGAAAVAKAAASSKTIAAANSTALKAGGIATSKAAASTAATTGSTAATTGVATKLVTAGAIKWAVAAAAIGGTVGVVSQAELAQRRPASEVVNTAQEVPPLETETRIENIEEPSEAAAPEAKQAEEPKRATSRNPRRRKSRRSRLAEPTKLSPKVGDANAASAPPQTQSIEEVRLLVTARRALSTNPARALRLCTQHAARFRDGRMVQEREVIAIEALARLGRTTEAKRRAARFNKRFPSSIHKRAIASALEQASKHP